MNTQQGGTALGDDAVGLLKPIPVLGPLVVFIAKWAGWRAAVAAIVVLVVLPLAFPLLMVAYMRLMPDSLRALYAKTVTEAFSVEDEIGRKVDVAVERFADDNNLRLDFVQQLQQSWVKGGELKSPVYSFPLEVGQHFEVVFSTQQMPAAKPCTNPAAAGQADEAINSEQLFTVRALGSERMKVGINDSRATPFGERFWADAKTEVDQVRSERRANVQVLLNSAQARAALECYSLRSTVLIVVKKTIKPTRVGRPAPTAVASR